jgi:hypothetical protein
MTAIVLSLPSAHPATIENNLFVCTGELIKDSATDYSIKETWVKDEDAYQWTATSRKTRFSDKCWLFSA